MIGLGCMRLSTEATRDDARSLEVLRAALDEGIALFDTADAYALDDSDVGHNERLIARAIAGMATVPHVDAIGATIEPARPAPTRTGPRPEIVTKGGLVRPEGAWVPKGNARHLEHAARASRDRLIARDADIAAANDAHMGAANDTHVGAANDTHMSAANDTHVGAANDTHVGAANDTHVGTASNSHVGAALDLYLLHVVDPRVPLATSVRALAKIRDAGIARRIGLSNVTLHQLEEALAITPIDAVELELGPYKLDALHSGLVAACLARGIRVLAYRPLGGRAGAKRIARDKKLRDLAEKREMWKWSDRHMHDSLSDVASAVPTPHEMVLAWLASRGVVPIPGATRVETVRSIARANQLQLQPDAVALLDEHFEADVGNTTARAFSGEADTEVATGQRVHPAARLTPISERVHPRSSS